MTRSELGEKYFKEGYNCSQSVALAFSDIVKLSKDDIVKCVSAFGGGFGRMREVCGAVSGMTFVLGYIYASTDIEDREAKRALYEKEQMVMKAFKEKNGSYICGDLLGVNKAQSPVPEARTAEYYKKRPCSSLVKDAIEIVEKLINEGKV